MLYSLFLAPGNKEEILSLFNFFTFWSKCLPENTDTAPCKVGNSWVRACEKDNSQLEAKPAFIINRGTCQKSLFLLFVSFPFLSSNH